MKSVIGVGGEVHVPSLLSECGRESNMKIRAWFDKPRMACRSSCNDFNILEIRKHR